MSVFEKWPYTWFGFWKTSEEDLGEVPLFQEVVDENWNPHDFQQILAYIENCPFSVASGILAAECPICGDELSDPGSQQSDGLWVWPSSLGHYLKKHHVRLPNSMVEHIRKSNYQIPNFNQGHQD